MFQVISVYVKKYQRKIDFNIDIPEEFITKKVRITFFLQKTWQPIKTIVSSNPPSLQAFDSTPPPNILEHPLIYCYLLCFLLFFGQLLMQRNKPMNYSHVFFLFRVWPQKRALKKINNLVKQTSLIIPRRNTFFFSMS